MFHPAGATSFPYELAALPLAGKIRFARYRSVGLAAAQTDCPARHFSLSATFLLSGVEIVAARQARAQSPLSVWAGGLPVTAAESRAVARFVATRSAF